MIALARFTSGSAQSGRACRRMALPGIMIVRRCIMDYQKWADYYGWKARQAASEGDYGYALMCARKCLVFQKYADSKSA